MTNNSRRTFMRNSLLGLAALPLGAGLLSRNALAAELPPLDTESAQAKALNYVKDASEAADHPAFEEGEHCENCMFYTADTQGCQLFPQNSVEPAGWCQSWTAKP
ncbi:high-potential iron-sulfur protein [Halomonas halocynthiae]|uniref:high-potential iron-sulfur protein n=1 Tax=Halomonas halocynthiae TaxID=176290 RepID=UPI00041CC84B|nr:high-potential iron-sulfur protein [Halomonas halocynthiae]